MKRLAAFLVALTMALSLAACSGNQAAPSSGAGNSSSLSTTDNSSASESSSTPEASNAPEESSSFAPESTTASSEAEASQPESEPEAPAASEGGKVLVAYFSATNTIKGVAEKIAAGVGGDLYQITPAEPYTSADLNYHDNNSRRTAKDPVSRPAAHIRYCRPTKRRGHQDSEQHAGPLQRRIHP